MDTAATLRTLELLADGKDPATGRSLPDASPYNQPAVVRSLFAAIRAVESLTDLPAVVRAEAPGLPDASPVNGPVHAASAAFSSPISSRTPPANAGKPWTESEDQTLCTAFDQGVSIKELAVRHGRSTTALNARLFKLGKIADPGIPLRRPVQPTSKSRRPAEGMNAKVSGGARSTA